RRVEGDPAAGCRPLHEVDVRVDQPRQQRATVPVDDPRREALRTRLGDRRDPAVVHPDVGGFAAETRPHPAQQEIIHARPCASRRTAPSNPRAAAAKRGKQPTSAAAIPASTHTAGSWANAAGTSEAPLPYAKPVAKPVTASTPAEPSNANTRCARPQPIRPTAV